MMSDPIIAFGALSIGELPMALTHVRTLEAFDGPLLAEFRSETGDTFLYSWCDRDGEIDRWIVVRTPTQDIARYLVRVATLQDLIVRCRDGFVYLVDLDTNDQVLGTFFIKVDALPPQYVPTDQSYYQSKIPPTDGEQQDVFVSEHWDYHQYNEYPRKYLQAYDFNALFGRHGDATRLPRIDYDLTTGYVYHTLFGQFGTYVPAKKRATLVGVSVASPGYVRFRVDPGFASDLRRAIERFVVNRDAIETTTRTLGRWISGRESESTLSDRQAKALLMDLCAKLEVRSDQLLERVPSTEMAAKAIRSYINRLAYLADQQQEQTAMLVGLSLPRPDRPSN
jgi:hypothetical protein